MIEAWAPFFLVVPPLALGLLVWAGSRAGRARRRRAAFIAGFDYHRLLDKRLAQRRPGLDPGQRREVLAGLAQWFEICRQAGRRPVSMPSQAADDAWHEFILFTRNYQAFCHQALGRFLHHIPAEAMASPTQGTIGIRRAWRLDCRLEGIDPRKPDRLPLLFALDAALSLPDGFHYRLDCLAGGGNGAYCASHIGCCSGCSTGGSDSCGDSSNDGGGDSGGDGGGCGGE
jgi:hypothetical protein